MNNSYKIINLLEETRNKLQKDIIQNKGNIELKKRYVKKYNEILERQYKALDKLLEEIIKL